MKALKLLALAALAAAPVVSFAQSNEPVTRAQVRAELVQLQKAHRAANAQRAAQDDVPGLGPIYAHS